LPPPFDHADFETTFLESPATRRERLESLAEIYTTALEELRERREGAHATLIVRLETLRTAVARELRYVETAGAGPLILRKGASSHKT